MSEVDEDEFKVIYYARKCRKQFKLSYRDIGRILNRHGITITRNEMWAD